MYTTSKLVIRQGETKKVMVYTLHDDNGEELGRSFSPLIDNWGRRTVAGAEISGQAAGTVVERETYERAKALSRMLGRTIEPD